MAILLFCSCDQIPLPSDLNDRIPEQNKSLAIEPDFSVTPMPPPPAQVEINKKVPDKEIIEEPAPNDDVLVAQTTSHPEQPEFSQELLSVVQNWTKVPKSVFPAENVIISAPLSLVFKSSSGQVLGTSLTPSGTKVQVLGMRGSTLIVANMNNNKLRGEIDIDQTDFKQLLSYRFEMNKKNKEAQILRGQQKDSTSLGIKEKTDNSPTPVVLDDIPDPLDFGHGRFCICKDCREKRLAKTGSLKTGFGLEP